MASTVDQPLLQSKEEEQIELQNEGEGREIEIRAGVGQVIPNLKHHKSFEILKSAVKICTSNIKFMFFMIFSIIPFFSFMVFYEVKLQRLVDDVPSLVTKRSRLHTGYAQNYHLDFGNQNFDILYNALQLLLLYLVLYPLLEMFSMIIIIKIAAKFHAGENEATLRQILLQETNLKGLFVTRLWVHWLSTCMVLAVSSLLLHHYFFAKLLESLGYVIKLCLHIPLLMLYPAMAYKYLLRSIFWNMGIVISILGEETGIGALLVAEYYGKCHKKTGLQLMLVFFVFCNVLRLPGLLAGLYNISSPRVEVTAAVIGLFCLGNLVKWVASLLFFYDCKLQKLGKKVDEEVGKAVIVNASDVS